MGRHSANATPGQTHSEQRLVVRRPRAAERRRVPASLLAQPVERTAASTSSAARRYVVPLLGFATTFAFLSASLVNPLSGAEAATTSVGGAAALVAPGQTFVVGAGVVLAADRDQYGVTVPPPPPPPEPVVEEVVVDEPTASSSSSGPAPKKAPSSAPVAGVPDPGTAKGIAAEMVAARGWGTGEYDCLVSLWNRESGWNVNAHNASSGAHGIPQALPGSKMASAGADWQSNPATQITWGLGYISGRYGTPCGAWAHSEANNWY